MTFLILQKGNVKLFTFNLKLSHSGEHVKQSSEYLENINKADIYWKLFNGKSVTSDEIKLTEQPENDLEISLLRIAKDKLNDTRSDNAKEQK